MTDFLSTLNERQREAVEATEGPLLILAGAGSGKTRVITVRIAYLISERHVPPHNILAVTFTNKAAQEMRERVTRLLEGERLTSAPLVSTFHSLCVRMLRRDIEKLEEGYTRSFTIYDQDDSARVVKSCIKDLGYDDQRLGARQTPKRDKPRQELRPRRRFLRRTRRIPRREARRHRARLPPLRRAPRQQQRTRLRRPSD